MKKLCLFLVFVVLILSAGCDNNPSVPPDITEDTSVSDNMPIENLSRVTVKGDKFYLDDGLIWFNGANTPWDKWNDFGGSFNESFWDSHFADMAEAGMNCSRVWISCNGDVGMNIDKDGNFTGATDKFWEDLDKLFELAKKHGIYIMATAQSFDHYKNTYKTYESWRKMIQDGAKIDAYVENYIVPLVQRYNDNPYLWSVDLCNEPDWVYENEESGKIPWENLSEYFSKAAKAIHENSDILVTVGLGMPKYNSDKYDGNKISDEFLKSFTGSDLSRMDFWSSHWYGWEEKWFGYPFNLTPEDYGQTSDRPSVIGECPALPSRDSRTLIEEYKGAYDNGWSGVLAWTSNGVDSNGGFDDVAPATRELYRLHGEEIRRN